MPKMDQITKQAHLFHSLLAEFRENISKEIAGSISENFEVPIDEATDKCSVLITGFMIHALYSSITKEMKDGTKVGEKFLNNIGKSKADIETINETYGNRKAKAKQRFKQLLEEYLGVPAGHTLSDFYYLRVRTASESMVKIVSKKSQEITLKDGAWDYTDAAENRRIIHEYESIKNDLRNKEKVCPSCETKGFFFKEFVFKGKDKAGFIYFLCPKCKRDIQYDILNETTRIQRGLFGFLFGKFS
jgi:transposase-like protein